MAKVIIDAGHGGREPGAIYGDRKEKDDTLRLALAVGEILKKNGVDVAFTRTKDVYNSPLEKAQIANREGGDFLISIHRNASPEPNQYSGVESLVFERSGKKVELAENINRELEEAGYRNLGIKERPGLVILRRSQMPAVLVEVGFLNTDADNMLFDRNFEGIAEAIAKGVLETVREDTEAQEVKWENASAGRRTHTSENMISGERNWNTDGGQREVEMGDRPNQAYKARMHDGSQVMERGMPSGEIASDGKNGMQWIEGENQPEMMKRMAGEDDMRMMPERIGGRRRDTEEQSWQMQCGCCTQERLYRVQTGAFRNREYAQEMLEKLLSEGFPAFLLLEDRLYKVQVGAYRMLDNAVRMEKSLRDAGYATFITI